MPAVRPKALFLALALCAPVAAQDAELRALMHKANVQPLRSAPAHAPAQVKLGEMLMFDKILSANRDISCATCHHPAHGLSDGLPTSIGSGGKGLGPTRSGDRFLGRNAPALWYLGEAPTLFHDGRVEKRDGGFRSPAGAALLSGLVSPLAVQALFPLMTEGEMTPAKGHPGTVWSGLLARVQGNAEYRKLLAQAFPGARPGFHHVANALAAYQVATFSPATSPFDRYVAGDDSALDEAQKRGALLFYGSKRCAECHSGPLLSDHKFHNVAAPQVGPGMGEEAPLDFGRGRETKDPKDRFLFRTPILRNVVRSGPWTHAGAFTSLQDLMRHYINPGVRLKMYEPTGLDPRYQVHVQEQLAAGVLDTLDPIVSGPNPMSSQDVEDLVAFLHALSDDRVTVKVPARVPSGIPVED
jgi:cytochrome c peroxidase